MQSIPSKSKRASTPLVLQSRTDFKKVFVNNYVHMVAREEDIDSLMLVQQGGKKSLKDYLAKFKRVSNKLNLRTEEWFDSREKSYLRLIKKKQTHCLKRIPSYKGEIDTLEVLNATKNIYDRFQEKTVKINIPTDESKNANKRQYADFTTNRSTQATTANVKTRSKASIWNSDSCTYT